MPAGSTAIGSREDVVDVGVGQRVGRCIGRVEDHLVNVALHATTAMLPRLARQNARQSRKYRHLLTRNCEPGAEGWQLSGSFSAQSYPPRAPMRRWLCGSLLITIPWDGSPGHGVLSAK